MFCVIRIRGTPGLRREVRGTLKLLRLDAVNRCVLIPETPTYKGMLQKVKDVVTWGEVEKEVLVRLLNKRLRLKGNKKIDESSLKQLTGYTYEQLADELMSGKIRLKDLEKIEPFFRLHPPSKGFKNVKQAWPEGDLGYRGKEINNLLDRML